MLIKFKKRLISGAALIIALIALLAIILNVFFYKRIAINLYNATPKDIYIYTMQSAYGQEPTIEEVTELKRVKRLKPHEKLSLPISTKYPDDSEFSIGWKIGSRISRGGAVRALINKKEGACIIDMRIEEYAIQIDTSSVTDLRCTKKIKIFQETIDP